MQWQIMIISGPDQGRVVKLKDGQSVTIGRGEGTDPQLSDPRVSRKHCQIEIHEGNGIVRDLNSSGGTFVNERQIDEQPIEPGDTVRLGQTKIRFLLETDLGAQTMASTQFGSEMQAHRQSAPPQNNLDELIGQSLHHFRIDAQIATGNGGVVFKGYDTQKDRAVAIKVLYPELRRGEEDKQRFVRGMKTMFPIRHPNIIRIYNAGLAKNKYCWVAMEYVDGESLTKVIERIGTAGMLDWQTGFRVAVHIARALEAAFDHKIVHRNITPQNILYSTDRVAKLGDLMLAKALEGAEVNPITQPGQLVGEAAYMAPERTRGSDEIDCRSDIYGLGATVYALLTGRPPFESPSLPDLVMKIRNDEPERPKKFQLSISDMFEGAVLRMLAKRPEDRYQTPTVLLSDLDRIGKFQGIDV